MRKSSLTIVAVLSVIAVWATSAFAADHPPLAKAPFDAEQANEFHQQWSKHIGKPVTETNSIGMKMVLLPPGEYTMGRTEEQFDKVLEIGRKEGREPARMATWEMLMMPGHQVRITKPFYMGATEVTVGQYRQFCEASGYKTEAEQGLNAGVPYRGRRPICTWRKPMVWIKLKQKDDEPVLHLCWNDCVAFCKWLSEKEGVEYCLPTEAEWEYACRAGSTTAWCFGNFEDFDRLGHEYMFVSEPPQGKHDRPSSVAQKKPNAFGLYDMHGNVWEYVADWWHRFTYKNSVVNDPTGPPQQSEKGDMRRIIRTGSFDWGRWGAQSVYRMRITQRSTQHPHQGFRVAMRLKGFEGVPPAADPYEQRRKKTIDPGPQKVDASATDKYAKELTLDLPNGVKMDFVLIPPGSFLMGSNKGFGDETPVHRVVISKPFYMAKYEVTQSQWEAVMGKHQWLTELTKGDNEMQGPTKAMNVLSWNDCQALVAAFQKKATFSMREKCEFALPTEAQWEYACRAGSAAEFHFGDDESELGEYAWYEGNMNWPGKPTFRGKAFYHVGGLMAGAFLGSDQAAAQAPDEADNRWLRLGLNALARAHELNYFADGHRGAAMVSAHLLCVDNNLDKRARARIGELIDLNWASSALCKPFPEAKPAPERINEIGVALLEGGEVLRQVGHNAIFAMLAIKAFRMMPDFATSQRIDGVCALIRSFTPWRDVDPDPDVDPPPFKNAAAASQFILREAYAAVDRFVGFGQGFAGHMLTFGQSLVELAAMGDVEWAESCRTSFCKYVTVTRRGPEEDAKRRPDHKPTDLRPTDAAYWEKRGDNAVGLGHLFKYPYAYYDLLRRAEDPNSRRLWDAKAYHLF